MRFSPGCQCCGGVPPCSGCAPGTTPAGWEVTFTGIVTDVYGASCDSYNDTFAVDTLFGGNPCAWREVFAALGIIIYVAVGDYGGVYRLIVSVVANTPMETVIAQWLLEFGETIPNCVAIDDDLTLEYEDDYYCDYSVATGHVTAVPYAV